MSRTQTESLEKKIKQPTTKKMRQQQNDEANEEKRGKEKKSKHIENWKSVTKFRTTNDIESNIHITTAIEYYLFWMGIWRKCKEFFIKPLIKLIWTIVKSDIGAKHTQSDLPRINKDARTNPNRITHLHQNIQWISKSSRSVCRLPCNYNHFYTIQITYWALIQ